MSMASLNISLNYNQVLNLALQLPLEERKNLAQQLGNDSRSIRLAAVRDLFPKCDVSQEEIDTTVDDVRKELYEKRQRG